ncbi:unnamed protein product [Discula destructiva]
MAANVPAPSATTTRPSPLSSFAQVSKLVYLYQPSSSGGRNASDSSLPSSPKLILVGGWMDAQAPHLAKYTAKLQALFPASPILLVRSFNYHFTTGVGKLHAEVAPAVSIIRSIIGEEDEDAADHDDDDHDESGHARRPEMLVMVFSNGGSSLLRQLYTQFRETAAHKAGAGAQPQLPPHITIFDSAPGGFSWSRSVTAFTLGAARSSLPVRLFVTAMAHLLSAAYWLTTVPWGRPGLLELLALAHNTRDENGTEVARTYLYSREDALVGYEFVEEHAAQARSRGYEVALERFEGTAHVAHARGDEGRYWAIVRDAWDRWTA